jgi:hypothetical protein
MTPFVLQSLPHAPAKDQPAPSRLLSFLAVTAVALAAPVALTVLGDALSSPRSILTAPENSLSALAVVLAGWLLLAYPLWPGSLLGGPSALDRFWPWLGLRAAEVGLILAVATPALVLSATFSMQPVSRIAEMLVSLAGVAAMAITYRLVHQTCSTGLRVVALLDAMLLLFAPIMIGYLMLEFCGMSIGWCWRISPLVLGLDVSGGGLNWTGTNMLIILASTALSAAAVPLVLPYGRWCREERRKAAEEHIRILT